MADKNQCGIFASLKKSYIKKFLIAVLVLPMSPTLATASPPLDTISNAFGAGKIFGEVGINFRVDDADKDSKDGDIGTAFLELDFKSHEFYSFTVGANFIAVADLWTNDAWEDKGFQDDGKFQQKSILRHAYLDYAVPDSKTNILVGREKFEKTESMDGDAHQGIQITSEDIPLTTLYLAAINRWINNATTDYDMDGIEKNDKGWRDGDDAFEGASSITYSIIAEIEVIKDQLTLTPFFNHQCDVITNYGATFEFDAEINDDLSLGLDGTYAFYDEDSDDPTDEDASSCLIHTAVSFKDFWIGVGYYSMSDDARVDTKAVGNNTFNPMEEGVYGANPDDNTLYLDGGYSHGPFEVEIILGDTEVDSSATGKKRGATEFDLYFTYEITKSSELELMFVNVDNDESGKDYQTYAGGIKIKF